MSKTTHPIEDKRPLVTPPPDATHSQPTPWFLATGTLLLYFLRFGYHYANSDQDETLPYLLHRLDPTLFAHDWFVQMQSAEIGIRTYFVAILEGFSFFFPVWMAVLVVYIAGFIVLAGAVYQIGLLLTRDRLAAAAGLVAALVLTPQWTLGGNDLAHAMLVPSMLAWGIALWGVVFFLRKRLLAAALLLGLATWMQLLVGLHLAGILCVVLLIDSIRDRKQWRDVLIFAGAFVLAALPAIVPILIQQATSAETVAEADAPTIFYLMAAFRAPHHYLFYSFPTRALVRFGMLALLGFSGLFWLRRKQQTLPFSFIYGVLATVASLCLFAFMFTEVWPVLFIAKLQLFKTTVFAKVLFILLICAVVMTWLPASLRQRFEILIAARRTGWTVVLITAALLIAATVWTDSSLRAKARPLVHQATDVAKIEAWAQSQSPRDAVFAVPPTWSGFRSRAQRAAVVTFKNFPFEDAAIYAWYQRLTNIAPIPRPDRGSAQLQSNLDAAFENLTLNQLHILAQQYNIQYIIRSHPLPDTQHLQAVYSAGDWTIYQVPTY